MLHCFEVYFTFVRQHRNAQVRLDQDLDETTLKGVYGDVLEHVETSGAPAQLVLSFQEALMAQFGEHKSRRINYLYVKGITYFYILSSRFR